MPWSKKLVKSKDTNSVNTLYLIAILVSILAIIVLCISLLIYANKNKSNHFKFLQARKTINKNSNVADIISTNNTHELKEAAFKRKFSHLMVPETSDIELSIVRWPLPPIPTNSNICRHDSKNSLVSEGSGYLIPRYDIELPISDIVADEYVKPTFAGYCTMSTTQSSEKHYIPAKSYLPVGF